MSKGLSQSAIEKSALCALDGTSGHSLITKSERFFMQARQSRAWRSRCRSRGPCTAGITPSWSPIGRLWLRSRLRCAPCLAFRQDGAEHAWFCTQFRFSKTTIWQENWKACCIFLRASLLLALSVNVRVSGCPDDDFLTQAGDKQGAKEANRQALLIRSHASRPGGGPRSPREPGAARRGRGRSRR